MTTLLFFGAIIYLGQVLFHFGALTIDSDEHYTFFRFHKSRKHFLLHLIPFYFIFSGAVWVYKRLKISWEKLGCDNE